MNDLRCPGCGRHSVREASRTDGSEESRCTACGWAGPLCFGKKHDPENVKCAGGNDVSYWSGTTHKREACKYFAQCKEAQMIRQEVSLSPPINLGLAPRPQVQPSYVQQAAQPAPFLAGPMQLQQPLGMPAASPQVMQMQPAQPMPQPPVQQVQPMQIYGGYYPAAAQQAPTYFVPPEHAQMPMAVPQNHVAPGVQALSFLTVPEPVEQGWWGMLANSLGRAGLKALGLTLANVSDHAPWGRRR